MSEAQERRSREWHRACEVLDKAKAVLTPAERDALVDALEGARLLREAAVVGDGRFICPTAFEPAVCAAIRSGHALAYTPAPGAHGESRWPDGSRVADSPVHVHAFNGAGTCECGAQSP